MDQIKNEFYESLFNVSTFKDIDVNEFSQLDETNENELNTRILNIVNQMRTDNKGIVQPLKIHYLTEKTIMNDELTSLLCEDHYKDEHFYVDYLAEIHQNIQTKMS